MTRRLVLVACLLMGCGADDSGMGRDAGPPDGGDGPGLRLDRTSQDFGTAAVGCPDGKSVAFVVSSTATGTTGPLMVTVTGPFGITRDECGGKPLGPLQSCTVAVQIQPQAPGSLSGMLSVRADPGGMAFAQLTGTAAFADPNIQPSTADFGDVMVGTTSSPRTFRVVNGGATPVEVEVSVSGADFALARSDCGSGKSIPAGAPCDMEVTFKPMSKGIKSGSLVVKAAGCGHTVTASMTGNGI